MKYYDAVMIVEKEIHRHKRMAELYERKYEYDVSSLLKADDERILIDALETVLKGDKNNET